MKQKKAYQSILYVLGACALLPVVLLLVFPIALGQLLKHIIPQDNRVDTSETMALSPDGQTIAYSWQHETGFYDVGSRIKFFATDPASVKPVLRTIEDAAHPRFSPDGMKLVFVRLEKGFGHIWTLDFATNTYTQITDGKWFDDYPLFYGPTHQILFERDSLHSKQSSPYIVGEDGKNVSLFKQIDLTTMDARRRDGSFSR